MQKITLRDNQEELVQRWMEEPTQAILCAGETGVGKTPMSVEYALRMGFQRVLIVGLKDTFEQWRDRTLAQSDHFTDVRNINATKKGQAAMADYIAGKTGWFFIGQQYLTTKDWDVKRDKDGEPILKKKVKVIKGVKTQLEVKQPIRIHTWRDVNPELIIYDEVHQAANSATNTWKTLIGMQTEWKLALSGTWYGNKFENAHGPAYWLWPDHIDASAYNWKKQWCATRHQYVKGGKTVDIITGEKIPGEFVKTLPCYSHLAKPKDAPPARVIEVDLTPRQRKVYDDLEEHMMAYLGEHPLIIEWPVAIRQKLRTVTLAMPSIVPETGEIYFEDGAESTKLDALYSVLDGEWAGQNAFIGTDSKVFAQFAVSEMQRRGYKTMAYTGDESSAKRKEVKRQWLEGEIQYIVATSAGSTGLDGMQMVCNKIAEISLFDSGVHRTQFIDRIWRDGGDLDNFDRIYISARGTKDQGQYSNLALQEASRKMSLRKS